MFSQKELDFMTHWELVRYKESLFVSKLLRGLPMAILFGLPIILSVVAVYILFPEWYTKISRAASGVSIILVIAVLVTILFFSYFRMHFKWEMNEQLYQELKSKTKKVSPVNHINEN